MLVTGPPPATYMTPWAAAAAAVGCHTQVSRRAFLALAFSSVAAALSGGSNACIRRPLRFGLTDEDIETYGWVCCDNERWAERRGWFVSRYDLGSSDEEVTFYDPACGVPLFVAPRGRSAQDFRQESISHGWPSFRDSEVITEHVIVKEGGEVVSSCGTHLGHDLPDHKGSRYCINLICMAGHPADLQAEGNSSLTQAEDVQELQQPELHVQGEHAPSDTAPGEEPGLSTTSLALRGSRSTLRAAVLLLVVALRSALV